MKKQIKIYVVAILFSLVGFSGCDKDDGSINFFTLDQDIQFGEQLKAEVAANPAEYPLLDETTHADAYAHLRRIRDKLLTSPELNHVQDFKWEVYIIDNDDVLNAFAAPGGYMYFYTGLIKYLDNEAQFAGVMAHEMAHADHRHSTDVITRQYGYSILVSILLGKDAGKLKEIAANLAMGLGNLKFSRKNEYEADEYAVKYLNSTGYDPKGIAGFFEKLESGNAPKTPEFLSTHPSPENRIEEINKTWESLGSKTGDTFETRYAQFKTSLD